MSQMCHTSRKASVTPHLNTHTEKIGVYLYSVTDGLNVLHFFYIATKIKNYIFVKKREIKNIIEIENICKPRQM